MDAASTTGSVRLADGRRLALVATGPEDGFPVLYFHGAIGSPLRVADHLAEAIDRLGVRWIAVQRPGFGGSDPAPGRTMLDFARDVEELAAALGARRLAVIGVGDRTLLADAEAGATATGAFLAATVNGVGGGVEDYLVSCRPWGFAPQEIGVEVHLWHGAQDALVPVEHAWQLAASLQNCRAAFDPDEGHFFFRRRAAEILERVVTAGRAAGTSRRGSRGTAGDRAGRPSPAG